MKKHFFNSYILTALAALIYFGFHFLLARSVGAEQYGQIAYYLSFVGIVSMFTTLNHAGLYMGLRIANEYTKTFSLIVTMQIILFLGLFIPFYIGVYHYIDHVSVTLLLLLAGFIYRIPASGALEFNSQKKITKSLWWSTVLPKGALVLLFSILYYIVHWSSIASYFVAYAMVGLILAGYFMYHFHYEWVIRIDIISKVWYFYLIGILGAGFLSVLKIVQKETGGYADLASLSLALLVTHGLSQFGGVLIRYANPKLHEAWKKYDIDFIRIIYKNTTFIETIIVLPLVVFLGLHADGLSIFFGKDYGHLDDFLYIILFGYTVDLVTGMTSPILRTTGNERIELFNGTLRWIMGLALLLIMQHEQFAIAYAIAGSQILVSLVRLFWVYRRIGGWMLDVYQLMILLSSITLVGVAMYGIKMIESSWTVRFCIDGGILAVYGIIIFFLLKKKASLILYQ